MHALGIPHTPAASLGSRQTGPLPLLYSWRNWWMLSTDRMAPSHTHAPPPSCVPCAAKNPSCPTGKGPWPRRSHSPCCTFGGHLLASPLWPGVFPEPTVHQAPVCVTWGSAPRACSWQSRLLCQPPRGLAPRRAFWKARDSSRLTSDARSNDSVPDQKQGQGLGHPLGSQANSPIAAQGCRSLTGTLGQSPSPPTRPLSTSPGGGLSPPRGRDKDRSFGRSQEAGCLEQRLYVGKQVAGLSQAQGEAGRDVDKRAEDVAVPGGPGGALGHSPPTARSSQESHWPRAPRPPRRQQRSVAALQGQEGRCWAWGPWASDRDLLGSASPATRWTQPRCSQQARRESGGLRE